MEELRWWNLQSFDLAQLVVESTFTTHHYATDH